MIDTTSLVKFGDMTKGGGLDAIFGTSGSGYIENTTGWAGVVLSKPTAIKSMILTSATNGFDASGSTSTITIKLMAKLGMPLNRTDGDELATTTFTDINATTIKTLISTNQTSLYTHIWALIYSGVWCILTHIDLDEATAADATITITGNTVILKSVNDVVPLNWNQSEVTQYRTKPIFCSQGGVFAVDLFANITHKGDYTGFLDVVGFSLGVYSRCAPTINEMLTKPFKRLENAVSGGNIIDRDPHHYGIVALTAANLMLPNHYHQFTVYGSSHSTGSSSNGLAAILSEYGNGLNVLRLTALPGCVLVKS